MSHDIDSAVIEVVEATLSLRHGVINPESRFVVDFPCSSIDFILIISGLEKRFKVKLLDGTNQIFLFKSLALKEIRINQLADSLKKILLS